VVCVLARQSGDYFETPLAWAGGISMVVPAIALVLSLGCMATMIYFNLLLFGIFVAMLAVAFLLWKLFGKRSVAMVLEPAE